MVKAKELLKIGKEIASKNLPLILTASAAVTSVMALYLGCKVTPKAMEKIEEAKDNKLKDKNGNYIISEDNYDNSLTFFEKVKAVGPIYAPIIAIEASSVACMFFANNVNYKRQAALLALYSIKETNAQEFKNKVKELTTDKKYNEIEKETRTAIACNAPLDCENVYHTGYGNTPIYDVVSNRYFLSSIEKVKQAVNNFNAEIIYQGTEFVYLNEFYDLLNIPTLPLGEQVGRIGMTFGGEPLDMPENTILDDRLDRPVLVLDYEFVPWVKGRYDD